MATYKVNEVIKVSLPGGFHFEGTSDDLATEIMHPDSQSDGVRLENLIYFAEDTDFSVEQCKQFALWLLKFAKEDQFKESWENKAGMNAVCTSIRLGASMFFPKDMGDLLNDLLEPVYDIQPVLVTVKMIGRIFEANPPKKMDKYSSLATKVFQIVKSLNNKYAVSQRQTACVSMLSIYALVAMGSHKGIESVRAVNRLKISWYTQSLCKDLRELRDNWKKRSNSNVERFVTVLPAHFEFLDKAIRILA